MLYRLEGLVRQVVLDDKGFVIIGVFGALKSHTDDAFRGLQVRGEWQMLTNKVGFGLFFFFFFS